MPEVTTEQFILEFCRQLDTKLPTEDKALLLGLGLEGLTVGRIAEKVSLLAHGLTNEEAIFLIRVSSQWQLDEGGECLIQGLLEGDLSEDQQWKVRANLIFKTLLSGRLSTSKANART